MPQYDSALFDPPAPVARAILRNPLTGQELSDVPMLLDTGADSTLLPMGKVKELGITIEWETKVRLAAFDGTQSESAVTEAHLRLGPFTFRGRFLIVDAPVGIIGRDLLNLLLVTLDGAHLTWSVQVPSAS